jgi:uncharacterized membrane protein
MGYLHPLVVHFAIALLFVAVPLRVLSLVTRDRIAFINPMAFTLIALGTVSALVAAATGDAAHGPVEAMPGLRTIVSQHEEWGEWSRNVFAVVFLIELVAMAFRNASWARYAVIASAVVGVAGLGVLYKAGERGGEVVYAYAGGVGIRNGNSEDVKRLLLAGLYQQALNERKAGNKGQAYNLMDEAAKLFPNDIEVKLARIESVLIDRNDPFCAIDGLQMIHPPEDNRFLRFRHAMLTADALAATGQRDGAIAVLQQLMGNTPNPRIQQKIDEIKKMPPPKPQP